MTGLSLTRLALAVSGLTLSLTVGAGVASADPDLGPAVNTTCTYDQVAAALNAQNPTAAAFFNASPVMQSDLRQFLAGSPSQRKQMAQEIVSDPVAQEIVSDPDDPDSQPYIGVLQQSFATCNNY
jgi:hemophore-related protein